MSLCMANVCDGFYSGFRGYIFEIYYIPIGEGRYNTNIKRVSYISQLIYNNIIFMGYFVVVLVRLWIIMSWWEIYCGRGFDNTLKYQSPSYFTALSSIHLWRHVITSAIRPTTSTQYLMVILHHQITVAIYTTRRFDRIRILFVVIKLFD